MRPRCRRMGYDVRKGSVRRVCIPRLAGKERCDADDGRWGSCGAGAGNEVVVDTSVIGGCSTSLSLVDDGVGDDDDSRGPPDTKSSAKSAGLADSGHVCPCRAKCGSMSSTVPV